MCTRGHSNTYNPGFKDHSNFKCSRNQTMNANQGIPQAPQAPQQRKPYQLEEDLSQFIKVTQASIEHVNQNQEIMSKNIGASIKNLKTKIGELSRQLAAHPRSSRGFGGNTIDNPKNENWKALKLRNRFVHSFLIVSGKRKEVSGCEKKIMRMK